MSAPVTQAPTSRRSWVEPALWIGVPVLLAVGPWLGRQWDHLRLPTPAPRQAAVRFTGDSRRDRMTLLERAWTEARRVTRTVAGQSPMVRERIARRQTVWLTETAVLLAAVDPEKAEPVATEAARRIGGAPERMGPEDLAAPGETPTGRLLRLADAFSARPGMARRLRRAALEKARSADWPGSRVYALCLIAQALAGPDPARARAVLQEAEAVTERLPGAERAGALAAVAGSSAGIDPPEVAQARARRAVRALEAATPGPGARAVAASLLAPAAPEMAGRLAVEAVERAGVPFLPPEESMPFRGPSGSSAPVTPALAAARVYDASPLRTVAASPARATEPAPLFLSRADPLAAEPVALIDSQRRRVAAALAVTHPALARHAAVAIRHPESRSGALTEVAALIEERQPEQAVELYRLALAAAEQIRRPVAARRAAMIRAATGLAAFDPSAALAVLEGIPPRLFTFQLNELASRMASRNQEAALRLVEQGERALFSRDNPRGSPFSVARNAIAEQVSREDPERAVSILAPVPGSRVLEGWLALARGLAGREGG